MILSVLILFIFTRVLYNIKSIEKKDASVLDNITILNKIIEAEKRAQSIVNEALDKESALGETLLREITDLRNNYVHREDARIDRTEAEEKAYADEQIQTIIEEYNKRLEQINLIYTENRSKWTEDIFQRIISPGEET